MIQYKIYDWRFDAEKFSEALQRYRPDWSDRELAIILQIDPASISNWRGGFKGSREFKHPSMSNFIRVCNELDLDPRQFFCLITE